MAADTDENDHMVRVDTEWQIDKHVPIALLFAIAIQTGGALWWAATINSRVTVLEQQVIALAPLRDTLNKLDATLLDLKEDVRDIKSQLRVPIQAPAR